MRKLLVLFVILILGCEDSIENFDFIEESPSTTLPSDPIVWFPFNGNSNDESGNNLHGVLYEGEYTVCRNNNNNSSLKLDINDNPYWGEENDRVEVLYDPIMDVDNITISAWVNINPKNGVFAGRNYSIASRWSLEYEGTLEERAAYSFYINPNLNLELVYNEGTKFTSEESITYGEWHHVAVTIGKINTRLYLNGQLIKEKNTLENLNLPKTNIDLILGERKQYNGYWYHLDGKLDDVGIWGRALTPCEINDLYNM